MKFAVKFAVNFDGIRKGTFPVGGFRKKKSVQVLKFFECLRRAPGRCAWEGECFKLP